MSTVVFFCVNEHYQKCFPCYNSLADLSHCLCGGLCQGTSGSSFCNNLADTREEADERGRSSPKVASLSGNTSHYVHELHVTATGECMTKTSKFLFLLPWFWIYDHTSKVGLWVSRGYCSNNMYFLVCVVLFDRCTDPTWRMTQRKTASIMSGKKRGRM